jgi:hypothetical protein
MRAFTSLRRRAVMGARAVMRARAARACTARAASRVAAPLAAVLLAGGALTGTAAAAAVPVVNVTVNAGEGLGTIPATEQLERQLERKRAERGGHQRELGRLSRP